MSRTRTLPPPGKTVPVRISEASIHRNGSSKSNSSKITILLYNLLGPATLVIYCPLCYFKLFNTIRSLIAPELLEDNRQIYTQHDRYVACELLLDAMASLAGTH
jgi:hypothetical protein